MAYRITEPTIVYPLRPNLNITIRNLPRDLTKKEVERIYALLQSLVIPQDGETNESR